MKIAGRGAERYDLRFDDGVRRRPRPPVYARPGFRPDRIAMWAVVLGVVLILAAATSSHAAALTRHLAAAGRHTVAGAPPVRTYDPPKRG